MEELQREAHKFETESKRLQGQIDRLTDPDRLNSPSSEAAATALSQAKRVRRATNLLVQRLAVLRDQL